MIMSSDVIDDRNIEANTSISLSFYHFYVLTWDSHTRSEAHLYKYNQSLCIIFLCLSKELKHVLKHNGRESVLLKMFKVLENFFFVGHLDLDSIQCRDSEYWFSKNSFKLRYEIKTSWINHSTFRVCVFMQLLVHEFCLKCIQSSKTLKVCSCFFRSSPAKL